MRTENEILRDITLLRELQDVLDIGEGEPVEFTIQRIGAALAIPGMAKLLPFEILETIAKSFALGVLISAGTVEEEFHALKDSPCPSGN